MGMPPTPEQNECGRISFELTLGQEQRAEFERAMAGANRALARMKQRERSARKKKLAPRALAAAVHAHNRRLDAERKAA